jgi:hypothetical protein
MSFDINHTHDADAHSWVESANHMRSSTASSLPATSGSLRKP